ncbi:YebC/PmpR family DNA-binding transcriptional regulator [Candidatus Parcubacteria bacterium]|nr:MAG: YebC/PmpR family DNA-binding transcriptional regulator [Candidatus Parcubacteria bacterium]
MSGHSKWAQIKRQKGVADIKRGQAFTKLARAISIAVREGGGVGDPESNFKLRLAIDKARSLNMPKENINRAIERGKGTGEKGVGFEEVIYEGFGPSGTALIIEAVTDNRLRTTSEVKNVLDKNGGSLGIPGSVSYLFSQKGLVTVDKDGKNFDDIFLIALDTGAEDLEDVGSQVLVYTDPVDLNRVREALVVQGLNVPEAELIRKSQNTIPISDKEFAKKILSLMEKIEDLDDVQKVYSNFDIPDQLLKDIEV